MSDNRKKSAPQENLKENKRRIKKKSYLSLSKKIEWLKCIDASDSIGLNPKKYKTKELLEEINLLETLDSLQIIKANEEINNIISLFIKDLKNGDVFYQYNAFTESNKKYSKLMDSILNLELDPIKIISENDCKNIVYQKLKRYLNDSLSIYNSKRKKLLLLSMNYLRSISANRTNEYLIINIPFTTANFYRNDSLILSMKIIVGKKSTPTPLCCTFITGIEIFPDWLVPKSIGNKELLHKVKTERDYLFKNHFELVTSKGVKIKSEILELKKYNQNNFPFYFRQLPGCHNALGAIKFNLLLPYFIFLHDTNQPELFNKKNRFLSHGCVRLEKPKELYWEISDGNADTSRLFDCSTINSTHLSLNKKIAVFITYMPAIVKKNNVIFSEDIYDLLKKQN